MADHNGFLVLFRMAQQEGPVTMTTFTAMAETTPARARIARDEMQRLGLLRVEERTPRGPVRSLLIRLTPAGREVGTRLVEMDELMRTHASGPASL